MQWIKFFIRGFREGSIQLWRNKFLSGTTILLGGMILFLLNFVFAVRYYADDSLKKLESRADFIVPIREVYDSFSFTALENELEPYSLKTEILPAQEFENFSVPQRWHIKFNDLSEVGEVMNILKKSRYDTVVGDWDTGLEQDFVRLVDRLLGFRSGIERAAVYLTILFVAGGILLMMNTFRLIVFPRREEIRIARLVGAETKFIAGPFLFEGFLLGLFSSIFSIIVFIFALREVSFLPGADIFIYLWNNAFSLEVWISGVIGFVGAWIAIKKYLLGKLHLD